MTEKNVEELMLMHKRIIENLEEFSMPALPNNKWKN